MEEMNEHVEDLYVIALTLPTFTDFYEVIVPKIMKNLQNWLNILISLPHYHQGTGPPHPDRSFFHHRLQSFSI